MSCRADALFPRIASFQALRRAARKALLSKRRKPGAAAFATNLEKELLRLERELLSGAYRPGGYVEIELHEPKHRIVSAAPFRDRVVHHAVMAVVAPIFERGFIAQSFANRTGKGAHRAVEVFERYRNTHAFVLRCDIYRFFPAIDHAVLKEDLRRRLRCARTLSLLDCIVDGSNAQEPVNLHSPGDDLFSPFQRRRGLPIGNLTSQWFANIVLDPLDHFCSEVLRAPYLRYVDDFALFANDAATLAAWRERIEGHLARRRLRLHPRKTFIVPTGEPAVFLGYELHGDGHRRLPEDSVARARNRVRGIKDRLRVGTLDPGAARARVLAWRAHADFAHGEHLQRVLLKDLPVEIRARPRGQRKRRRKTKN